MIIDVSISIGSEWWWAGRKPDRLPTFSPFTAIPPIANFFPEALHSTLEIIHQFPEYYRCWVFTRDTQFYCQTLYFNKKFSVSLLSMLIALSWLWSWQRLHRLLNKILMDYFSPKLNYSWTPLYRENHHSSKRVGLIYHSVTFSYNSREDHLQTEIDTGEGRWGLTDEHSDVILPSIRLKNQDIFFSVYQNKI